MLIMPVSRRHILILAVAGATATVYKRIMPIQTQLPTCFFGTYARSQFQFVDDFEVNRPEWMGTTWVTADGACVNTPTAGSELVSNGTFDADTNWMKPVGGSIAGGVAVYDNVAVLLSFRQSLNTVQHRFVRFYYTVLNHSAGSIQPAHRDVTGAKKSANGVYKFHLLGTGSNQILYLYAGNADTMLQVDNVSGEQPDTPTLFRVIPTPSPYGKVEASWAIESGTLAGVVMCLDAPDNPTSFVVAYHNGTSFSMMKLVDGVSTALISQTVTYVPNAKPAIVRTPGTNVFRAFYNDVQINVDQLIENEEIVNNTYHGLFSTDPANACTEFTYQNFLSSGDEPLYLGAIQFGDFNYNSTNPVDA